MHAGTTIERSALSPQQNERMIHLNAALQTHFLTARANHDTYRKMGLEKEALEMVAPLREEFRRTLFKEDLPFDICTARLDILMKYPAVFTHPLALGKVLEILTHLNTPSVDKRLFSEALQAAHGMLSPENPEAQQTMALIASAFEDFSLGCLQQPLAAHS